MRFSSLQQWLDWQETLHPKAIDMSLQRMVDVAASAGIDQASIQRSGAKIISVAGTNGKGSCVRTLEQLLLAQGLSVGAFTSPHVLAYNERIRVNGQEAGDEQIMAAFAALDAARGDISLTYFEFATLAAAWLFKQSEVDFWLLEVGLGGRLDSVNTWSADLAIVTSIGIDHVQFLGDNRDDIGREKAGIFRPQQTAICADLDPPQSIHQQAQLLGTSLRLAGRDFSWRDSQQQWYWSTKLDAGLELTLPLPRLPGPSVAAALMALAELDLMPAVPVIASVLRNTALAGRYQTLAVAGLQLILDVAHNPHAVELLSRNLSRDYGEQKILAVFAAMGDKDLAGIVEPLLPRVDQWYLPALAIERCATPAQVGAVLSEHRANWRSCSDMQAALRDIQQQWPNATVLVFGSFYTVEACLKSALDNGGAAPAPLTQ